MRVPKGEIWLLAVAALSPLFTNAMRDRTLQLAQEVEALDLGRDMPENRSEQCDGEESAESLQAYWITKRRDRCCLADWPAVPSVESDVKAVFDARKMDIDAINTSIKEEIAKGDAAYKALQDARKEEVTDDWQAFATPYTDSVHEVWMKASALECERYDLKTLWHNSFDKWGTRRNPFSSQYTYAWEVKSSLIDPLRTTVDSSWEWRDKMRSKFMPSLRYKAKPIVSQDSSSGYSLGYNGHTGQTATGSTSGVCVAIVYNPITKNAESYRSTDSENGIAAVWNPITKKVETQQAEGKNSIGGCYDPNNQRVEFREKSSCVWDPVERALMWFEIGKQDGRGLGVVAWDAKEQKLVNFTRSDYDGGSVTVVYRTPGGRGDDQDEDAAFQSATSCSFTRRRRRRRRTHHHHRR